VEGGGQLAWLDAGLTPGLPPVPLRYAQGQGRLCRQGRLKVATLANEARSQYVSGKPEPSSGQALSIGTIVRGERQKAALGIRKSA